MQDRLTKSVETYTEALSKATDPTEIQKLTESLNFIRSFLLITIK